MKLGKIKIKLMINKKYKKLAQRERKNKKVKERKNKYGKNGMGDGMGWDN